MSGTRHSPYPPHRSRGRHHSDDLHYDSAYDRDDDDGYDRVNRRRRESRVRESRARRSGYRGAYSGDEGVRTPDEDDEFDDRRHRSRRREYRPSSDRQHRERVRARDERIAWDSMTESEDIPVDSRPSFARPPDAKLSPRANRRERDWSRDRYSHYPSPRAGHKAKESPATSPMKKRDRERDREGHNRHRPRRESPAVEDGDKRLRDRRRRGHDTDHEREHRNRETKRHERREKHTSNDSANSATVLLSSDALAQLDQLNRKADEDMKKKARKEEIKQQKKEKKKKKYIFESGFAGDSEKEREKGWESSGDLQRKKKRQKDREKEKKRLVSGAYLEEGRSPELRTRGGGRRRVEKYHGGGGRGGGDDYYFSDGYDDEDEGGAGKGCFQNWTRKKKIIVTVGVCLLLLAIIIAVAVVVSKKNDSSGKRPDGPVTTGPSHSELDGISPDSIPVCLYIFHLFAYNANVYYSLMQKEPIWIHFHGMTRRTSMSHIPMKQLAVYQSWA